MSDELTAGLASALIQVLEPALGRVEIRDLVRLTGGANRDTWSFDAVTEGDDVLELVLQCDRVGVERSAGSCALEARVVQVAANHGVPVAQVLVFGEVPNPLGRSFSVNSRLRGETIGRRLLRDETWATARTQLVRESAQALAAIHQIPQAELAPTAIPSEPDPLGALFETYVATGDAHPTLDLAFRWLDLNRPPPEPLCLVHGDFRLGNLLFAPTGLAAALDWESTHIGHPGEDLGWLCVRAWRFGGAHPVAGLGSYDQLLDAYEAEGGIAMTKQSLRWWEVFGTLRWGVVCLELGGDYRAGRTRSLEMAAIGRRVVENEYDLLRLLK